MNLESILNLRIGLDQIKPTSKDITDAKKHLDSIILSLITGFTAIPANKDNLQ